MRTACIILVWSSFEAILTTTARSGYTPLTLWVDRLGKLTFKYDCPEPRWGDILGCVQPSLRIVARRIRWTVVELDYWRQSPTVSQNVGPSAKSSSGRLRNNVISISDNWIIM
jgi:hypothetical protein